MIRPMILCDNNLAKMLDLLFDYEIHPYKVGPLEAIWR